MIMITTTRPRAGLAVLSLLWALSVLPAAAAADPPAGERAGGWTRHAIDDSSAGADGVRLADADGDGRLDVATAWEEGGLVRVYLNPGPSGCRERWPAVTAGEVGSPEDAVLVDLDGDGAVDVVSASEGRTRAIHVHWAPPERSRYRDGGAWATAPLPAASGVAQWMFCLPMDVDGEGGMDLVAGSKGAGAAIGWFQSPADARDLTAWRWRPLRPAGWVMSLIARDVDGDGDLDVVASDRKGPHRGCFWLENPRPAGDPALPWREHPIGGEDREVMFVTVADVDRDGRDDVLAAVAGDEVLRFRHAAGATAWERLALALPSPGGTGKAVAAADLDLDGTLEIVVTCEHAAGASGVIALRRGGAGAGAWEVGDVSGAAGVKFDLVEPLDLDGDGDLDLITCEEREGGRGLGVVWYENPAREPTAAAADTGGSRPFILLTNDDGVLSEGLLAILLELEAFADVIVAAPAMNVSGSSQSVAIGGAIEVKRLERSDLPSLASIGVVSSTRIWSIDAPPASCVHIAVNELAAGRRFDLAVSGVNRGQNIGGDIELSGTVGAARMARDLGVPAVALSLAFGSREFGAAARRAVPLVRELLERRGDAPPLLLNVNFPHGSPAEWKEPVLARPGAGAFRIVYKRREPEGDGAGDGEFILEPSLRFNLAGFPEGTDGRALAAGHVTVTALPPPDRDEEASTALRAWKFFTTSPETR